MRVLLAVDGTVCSEAAVQTVIDRFRPGETDVKVIHAVEWMREMPLCFQYGAGPEAGQDVVGVTRGELRSRARDGRARRCAARVQGIPRKRLDT